MCPFVIPKLLRPACNRKDQVGWEWGVGHLLELKGPIDLRFSSSQWELGHAGLEQNIHIIIAARQL